MVDVVDRAVRSRMMSAIRSRNTSPELVVRSALHRRGFRYRLNDVKLPGKPDLVLPKYRAVIFVHGCFWHGHDPCRLFRWPSSNTMFWQTKIGRNRERDAAVYSQLNAEGWRVLYVWECALRGKAQQAVREQVVDRICKWLQTDESDVAQITAEP